MVGPNDRKLRGQLVRLITETTDNIGLVSIDEALTRARNAGMDLVEVASKSNPAVCRIMDFGKFQYEESKKKRESRKKQTITKLKEIQFHPNIDEHDYQTKLNHLVAFLKKGYKVKTSVFFRGREMAHRELGREILDRVIRETKEVGHVDSPPKAAGRNIIMYLAPGATKQ